MKNILDFIGPKVKYHRKEQWIVSSEITVKG